MQRLFTPFFILFVAMSVSAQTNITLTSPASATPGRFNTVVGLTSPPFTSASMQNTFVGNDAGKKTTGSYNTFLGTFAGDANTSPRSQKTRKQSRRTIYDFRA
jgi:trimeric autotransporter adhesin